MSHKLKKDIHEIEHLKYSLRKPIHASLFENKAMLSKFAWDIHTYNAKKFYRDNNPDHESSFEKYGYITGVLNEEESKLLKKIYSSCKKTTLDPFDFDSDYSYEPRESYHKDMARINNYYEPSKFFFDNIPILLDPLKGKLEKENKFYWKVASCRVFAVKPVRKTQGFHKDDQPSGINKLFFYPNGVNKIIGSTTIIDKLNNEVVVDLKPGSWLLFNNSQCAHQAYTSENSLLRPTIEIDIMSDFISDTTLNYTGINSWHPWFPILDNKLKNKSQESYNEVYDRNLKRLAGLCILNKSGEYKFPCELSDYYDESSVSDFINGKYSSTIFSSNDIVFRHVESDNMENSIKYIVNKKGLLYFLFHFIKLMPLLIVKKIINKIIKNIK